MTEVILISDNKDYKSPYFPLSNHYTNKKEPFVSGKGRHFKSVTHYMQYRKFSNEHNRYALEIVCTKTPHEAKLLGSRNKDKKRDWKKKTKAIFDDTAYSNVKVRSDWKKKKNIIMRKALYRKFDNSAKLKKLLLSTNDKELIKVSSDDSEKEGFKSNTFGKILMGIRKELAFKNFMFSV